jgi:hypothetical protein
VKDHNKEQEYDTKVKELGKCLFCGGRVFVVLGLSGDYVWNHKAKELCPVKNHARFETLKQAERFWAQKRKKTPECTLCVDKDRLIRTLRKKKRLVITALEQIRRHLTPMSTNLAAYRNAWSRAKDVWEQCFADLEKFDE